MSRPPWDGSGPVGDPGPDLPSMVSTDSPSAGPPEWAIILVGALALALVLAIGIHLGSTAESGREVACEYAGGHSYDAGPVVLCLDDDGRVIER